MISIKFTLNGIQTIIQSKKGEKMRNICNKFISKIGNEKADSLYFIYNGKLINFELTVDEQANSFDKNNKIMNILVYSKSSSIINEDKVMIKSKEIICPKCTENCRIKFKNFKIELFGCKNGHSLNNIILNEFEETQKINASNIICDNCKNNNKSITHNNQFFICLNCKQNLCLLCNSLHNKNHNIIDYNKKNYICQLHNDTYISYCEKCNINLCILCEEKHKAHKIIIYRDIFPDINKIKEEMAKYKGIIDNFKNDVNIIFNHLNQIINNIENIYNINYNLINNFELGKKNFEILKNINDIKSNMEINNLEKIINLNYINNKIKEFVNIYSKMTSIELNRRESKENKSEEESINIKQNNKKIKIKYKLNSKENKLKLFGYNFVINNKNKCFINVDGKKLKLSYSIDTDNYKEIKDELEIELIGIDNITNMSYMFNGCNSLLSITDLNNFESSNITDMSYMFCDCSSLKSLPDISVLNTINVKNMKGLFNNCVLIRSLPDISKWNTSNVTDMSYLFYYC